MNFSDVLKFSQAFNPLILDFGFFFVVVADMNFVFIFRYITKN